MKKYRFLGVALLGATLMTGSLTSCKDSNALDINYNPNYPSTATYKQLVPAAEASTVSVMGLYAQLTGNFWCQYTTQGNSTNQYNTLANYAITTSSSYPPVSTLWNNSYANALEDLKLALTSAEESEAWNYWMVAKILQAYQYLVLTDTYGDIPFTQALDINTYPEPEFDDSKTVVYPGILEMLDAAIAKLDDAKTSEKNSSMSTNDAFFSGDMDSWAAFAKSLKLKMYLKDFDSYKSQIQSLLAAGGLLEGDCAWTSWEDATNKSNPLYEYNIRQLNTTENMRACHTFLEYMLDKNDPRIVYLYNQTTESAAKYSTTDELIANMNDCYEGLPCGTKPTTELSVSGGIPISQSSRAKQSYDDPVYLMNASESMLMIAEAYARLGNTSMAEEYYNKAVLAGFTRYGLDGTSYLNTVYKFDTSNMLKSIAMQYWVTYAGANSYDGWITRNRLGIPVVQGGITVRVTTTAKDRELSEGYELGNLVDPGSSNLNAGEYPMRLLYPTNTTLYNTSAAKYVQEHGNSVLTKLWWEK